MFFTCWQRSSSFLSSRFSRNTFLRTPRHTRMYHQDQYIASIDQGTSSTRVILYNQSGKKVLSHQVPLETISLHPGWAEQDPLAIKKSYETCMHEMSLKAKEKGIPLVQNIKAVGITNQRETLVVWDKKTGQPLHNSILWSDLRTHTIAKQWTEEFGSVDAFRGITGLPISPYFTALKMRWVLDQSNVVRDAVERGDALFGTVDSWVIWNLTGGVEKGVHVTDVTNASRTLLMDIQELKWSGKICSQLGIPREVLPEIHSSSEVYGHVVSEEEAFHGVPVSGCLGDQQSALVGQQCFIPGEAKNTYGTGCFMLYNTGTQPVESKNQLLTTVAYQLGKDQKPHYALEGSISTAGSGIDWLKNNMGFIKDASEIDTIGSTVKNTGGLYFVPAFSGLFAPYWRSDARGVAVGITHYTQKAHFVRAMLEGIAFQTTEILEAMEIDSSLKIVQLKVDGGLTNSKLLMQIQSDLLVKPDDIETTARGAAFAAGLAVGLFDLESSSFLSQPSSEFSPEMSSDVRQLKLKVWRDAVTRSFDFSHHDEESMT